MAASVRFRDRATGRFVTYETYVSRPDTVRVEVPLAVSGGEAYVGDAYEDDVEDVLYEDYDTGEESGS